MLSYKNISKSYFLKSGSQIEKISILQNLNLDIPSGQVVAIVGSSGSGKSTLLGLTAGLDQPDQGEVFIQGTSLQSIKINDLTLFRAAHVGIVFQQYHLIPHLTAIENLALPLEIQGRSVQADRLDLALKQVGLFERKHHKPSELSGGESQRLALARALIIEPALLLADEPSGSLDVETGQKVMNVFFDQVRQQNTTTVLVTHDMDLARECDVIYKLQNGQLHRVS